MNEWMKKWIVNDAWVLSLTQTINLSAFLSFLSLHFLQKVQGNFRSRCCWQLSDSNQRTFITKYISPNPPVLKLSLSGVSIHQLWLTHTHLLHRSSIRAINLFLESLVSTKSEVSVGTWKIQPLCQVSWWRDRLNCQGCGSLFCNCEYCYDLNIDWLVPLRLSFKGRWELRG